VRVSFFHWCHSLANSGLSVARLFELTTFKQDGQQHGDFRISKQAIDTIMSIGREFGFTPVKYRADNDHTERIFKFNELWFSDPREFNDPFDCNTPITTITPLVDIKAWLKSVGVARDKVDDWADKLQHNPDLMKDATHRALSKIGVCCFSTLNDSILQWSHYSNFHRGICLKFDITEHPELFNIPIIVTYRTVMQHYNHFVQSDKIVEYLIKPKYKEWSYESAIRVVKSPDEMRKNGNNRAFTFENEALREVIFGHKTSNDVKNKYKQICETNDKRHAHLSEMNLNKGLHYRLTKII